MTLIKWHGSENPAEGALVETARFTDNSPGDTSSYETGQAEQEGSPCQVRDGSAWITGVYDYEEVVPLLGWSFVYSLTESAAPVDCGNEPPALDPPVKQYILEIADTYGTWTTIASGTGINLTDTLSGSFAPGATARYVRLRINYEVETYDANGGAIPFPTPQKYTYARISDFRLTAESDCGLPDGIQTLTRGTTANFTVDGDEPPTIDEWEIYRCIAGILTLVDSSDLGTSGLAGWLIKVSTTPGNDYDIYAPPNAVIADDYEARIDAGLFHSINFNVIAEGSAGDETMAERPSIGEAFRYGFQPNKDQAVQANRLDPALKMAVPTPVQPSTQVQENGSDGIVDAIPHKEMTTATVSGPMHHHGMIEQFYQLLGEPYIKAVPGSSLAFDTIFIVSSDRMEAAARTTIEQGQRDGSFPSRFDTYEHEGATLTFGKTDNTMEFNGIAHRLNERLSSYSVVSPDEVPFIPVNAAQNNHYLGTAPAYWGVGTASVGCDLHEAILGFPPRRSPLNTQCTGDGTNSFKDTVRIAANPTLSLALSHNAVGRGQTDYIRNKTGQIWKFLNRSPVNIEAGFPYEVEVVANVVALDRAPGEVDAVTTGIHNFGLKRTASMDPFGIGTPCNLAIRVRSKFSGKPASTNIPNF
jgi:hypothetical protein